MPFRLLSAVMAAFCGWAASVQLNDPDPERWVLMYLAVAFIALVGALGRPVPLAALTLFVVALSWAASIAPELLSGWRPSDLTATMSSERPEVEYGREFVGLLILASYTLTATLAMRRLSARGAQPAAPQA
jgi:hypothetical protein